MDNSSKGRGHGKSSSRPPVIIYLFIFNGKVKVVDRNITWRPLQTCTPLRTTTDV